MSVSFVTPWTVAQEAPLSMGFTRQEYWSGLPFPSPADLPNPGIKPRSPALAGRFFIAEPPGKPRVRWGSSKGMIRGQPRPRPGCRMQQSLGVETVIPRDKKIKSARKGPWKLREQETDYNFMPKVRNEPTVSESMADCVHARTNLGVGSFTRQCHKIMWARPFQLCSWIPSWRGKRGGGTFRKAKLNLETPLNEWLELIFLFYFLLWKNIHNRKLTTIIFMCSVQWY